ncbi:MAG: hypothetical protein Q4D41_08350 [Prevotellaceae bacterium]|nr:hypothetical protein [Prevotellaceae bacterium]
MKDVNNRMQRMELAEKFLNAQTTVEEERLLLRFYQNCNIPLTSDEEDIRLIVLSTIDNGLSTSGENIPDMDALEQGAKEFDRLMQTAEQEKPAIGIDETDNICKVGNIKPSNHRQIARKVALSVVLAAAAVIGFVFLSPKIPTVSNQSVAMVSGDTMSTHTGIAESGQEQTHKSNAKEPSSAMQMQPEHLSSNQARPATVQHKTSVQPHTTKATVLDEETAVGQSRTMNAAEIYDVVTTAFGSSEDVIAKNIDGQMCITVTAKDGTKMSYAVSSVDSETYTLVALD